MNTSPDNFERLARVLHDLNKPALHAYLALSLCRKADGSSVPDDQLAELRTLLNDQKASLEREKHATHAGEDIHSRYAEQFQEIGRLLKAEYSDIALNRFLQMDRDNTEFTDRIMRSQGNE